MSAAVRIAGGSREKLRLGNMTIRRDWGWAPEYVEAMWLMLQQSQPDDYVIARGESTSLEGFVAEAFASVNLDWREHVATDPELPHRYNGRHGEPSQGTREAWQASKKQDEPDSQGDGGCGVKWWRYFA